MKLKHLWAGWLVAAMTLAAGCTSTPTRTTTLEAKDRSEYIKTVDRRLDNWEEDAADLDDEEFGKEMMASVRDARAELRNMESAPSSEFDAYKRRVESRLDYIENMEKRNAE
jgi:hypothetical protein